jgi:hypothetical protein
MADGRFAWTAHNMVGHPVMEALHLLGFEKAGEWVHDITAPKVERQCMALEIVLEEEHDDGVFPERTVARVEDGEVHIVYEKKSQGHEHWSSWQDMGATISVANVLLLADRLREEGLG